MSDSAWNYVLARGTTAQRTAFTPNPPTLAGGPPNLLYLWFDTDLGQLFYWTGAAWAAIATVGADVAGPGSATDNALARFDGTTGKLIQNSAVTLSDAGAFTFPDDVRQTFNPGANAAGLNVGSQAGDPGTLSNGDLWYDSAANTLDARINGASLSLIGGGTGSTDNVILRADGTGGVTAQGGGVVTLSDAGALGFPDDVRQTFNPGSNAAGINVGALAGDPGTPVNGDLWYDSTANELTARINGANVALGAGGGGSPGGSSGQLQYNNAGSFGGTDLSGDVATSGTAAVTLAVPLTPGGRLTLTSNTPVMTADATAQGTVYYAPYVHARLPLYTGSAWVMRAFSQLTLTLNSTDNVSGSLYDIFVVDVGGTLTLGTGPAWTNTTTRADAIALLNGIWTNNTSIALRANGSALTGSPFAANIATYLGTIYCTANGQTGMAFEPAAASGGTNNILGLSNAYNLVPVAALVRNSKANWTVANTSWAATDASNSCRCSWVDGLRQSTISAQYHQYSSQPTVGKNSRCGMSLDSTSATPRTSGRNSSQSANTQSDMAAFDVWMPQIGFHFIQMQQFSDDPANDTLFLGDTPPMCHMTVQLRM